MYYRIITCILFISITNYVYPKKIELSKFFIYDGKVDDKGNPNGDGKLELTYYFHHTSPSTGKEEKLIRKDVLEGDFSQGTVQSAKLLIERYNSPFWITSASFKGKMKYEFASDMSYIQYTLEEGVFKDSKYNKIVIMPGKPLIIRRSPTDTHCTTQVMSPGYLLTDNFELKETQNPSSVKPSTGMERTYSLEKYIPSPIPLSQVSYCKLIVDWVKKSQKKQRYQQSSWPYSFVTITKNLWSKSGSNYSSRKFYNSARFSAAFGFRENYSDPFEGLLHQPEGEYSFSLNSNVLTYSNKDQIQIQCETHPRTGKPVRPSDGATETFGCKSGTRTSTTQVSLLGTPFKIKYSVTCNHKTYQSSYFNVVYGDGTPVNQGRDAQDVANNRYVRPKNTRVKRSDDYAPWRQTHTQSIRLNLDEIARLNKINKKELVAYMILTPEWDMPLITDKTKYDSSANWGIVDLDHAINIDHAVLIHFLWNQFGMSEDYLNNFVQKLEKKRKDSIYNLTYPFILSAKPLLKKANDNICIDNQIGPSSFKQSAEILIEAYSVCQKADLKELTDSVRGLLKTYSAARLYYATTYDIETPELDIPSCINIIKSNPPKEGLVNFLSICRDNAFRNGNYDQVLIIANELIPLIQNQSDITNEDITFDNYYKTICAMLKKNMTSEAIAIANEYIDKTPSSVLPYETLCYIYAYQRDKKSAMEIWKNRLLKSDKKYAEHHPNSAACNLMKQLKWIKK